MPTPILLMTRPRNGSDRFLSILPKDVRARITICHAPLIRIEPLGGDIDLAGVAGVIFSSANGVAAAATQSEWRDLPAYCVGGATTKAAQQAGWSARMLGPTADALVAALLQAAVPGPLLHLTGVHTRGNVAQRLTNAGLATHRQPVYDQQLLPFSEQVKALVGGSQPVIAPIFSPRTARHFVGQCPKIAHLYLIAISPAAAKPLSNMPCSALTVAARPDAAAMAEQVENMVNHLCRVESSGGAQ